MLPLNIWRFILAVQFNPLVKEFQDRTKVYGMYSDIARRTGVTPQHVRRVAVGLTTSKRIWKVLERENRKRKKEEGSSLQAALHQALNEGQAE
jgi:hypothetical protein